MPISNTLQTLLPISPKSSGRTSFYKRFVSEFNTLYFKEQLNLDNRVIIFNKIFRFNNLTHFNTKLSDFKKQYGKPTYSSPSRYNCHVHTLVYKTKIAGVPCRATLIFYKEKLILFNYVFRSLSKRNYQSVLNYATAKYAYKFDQGNYNIVDNSNNLLAINQKDGDVVFNFFSPLNKIQASFEEDYGTTKLISFQEKVKLQSKTS